jgi:putative membrane protein
VTTISFLIISRLPIGIEIDSLGKAAISAAVFGVWGFWSALIGSIALAIVNSILLSIVRTGV